MKTLLLIFALTSLSKAYALDVPIRIDLGAEVCVEGQSYCSRTPFSGQNTEIHLTMTKDFPETWEGQWQGSMTEKGRQINAKVHLKVEASAAGYAFRMTSEVNGSKVVQWLKNLDHLDHTELQGVKTQVGSATVLPYLYFSQPL